ncbi:MAG TPA: hypothetical protein VGW58_02335 [Pyrinomonadaceae bacterium]|nr:hypothetical protein [Pyrinomonadaceae bacterium]
MRKKIVIAVVALLLLSQIPFAYRRYKLRRLSAAIQRINSQRTNNQVSPAYAEYKGVVHVHSFLGGHSSGSFSEIIDAAKANDLNFVVMTEHTEKDFDTAAMTLQGVHRDVLFVNGNETSAENGDRLLVLPEKLSIVAYPEEFKNWETAGLNGVEVYNVYTNTRKANSVLAFFDVIWSHRAYPDLLFALYFERPNESLKKWDQELARKKLTATAGNDSHANIGVSLRDSAGKTLAGIQLDPYSTSFRLVRLHVLLPADQHLDNASLLEAIRSGHCFIGFDLFGDTSGFSFEAHSGTENRIQGDQIPLQNDTRLRVHTPVASRVVLFKDGSVILNESGITTKEIPVTERGVYRVEVYLPEVERVIGEKPWIISNPIYVR